MRQLATTPHAPVSAFPHVFSSWHLSPSDLVDALNIARTQKHQGVFVNERVWQESRSTWTERLGAHYQGRGPWGPPGARRGLCALHRDPLAGGTSPAHTAPVTYGSGQTRKYS